MIYEAIDLWNSPSDLYLQHYGVKGMRWGHRKQIPLVGRVRRFGQNIQPAASRLRSRVSTTAHNFRTSKKVQLAKKVAIGTAVVGGAALAAYGGMKAGKYLASPAGKAAVQMAKESALFKANRALYGARNMARTGRTVAGNAAKMVRNNPVGHFAQAVGRTNVGKAAFGALSVASLASDVNTARQWVGGVRKRGKITKGDTWALVKDLANPIPDNIPGIAKKNKYDYK